MERKFYCRVCASVLEVQESGESGSYYLLPCKMCIDSAKVSARNAGYDDGYDDGYSDGCKYVEGLTRQQK